MCVFVFFPVCVFVGSNRYMCVVDVYSFTQLLVTILKLYKIKKKLGARPVGLVHACNVFFNQKMNKLKNRQANKQILCCYCL